MGHRDMIWSRHQPAQLLAWGIRFFLAAALTATQTPGDYAPFALGCVAACGPGAGGIAALLGAGSMASRIVYTIVGLAGLWCISLLFRHDEVVRHSHI